MSFEFIQELSEAKLFRNPTKIKDVRISQLSDTFFNAILAIEILKHTDPVAAQKYAKQTLAYGNLNGWRSSGSDLHNLAHLLINNKSYSDRLEIDRVISVPELQFKTYLRNIAQGKKDLNFDRRFLLTLQKQLGINSPGLKSARRLISDWSIAVTNEKQLAATRVYMGLQKDLQQSDMWLPFTKTIKRNKLLLKDADIPKSVKTGTPLWAKMAIAGVAGYAIGRKLASL
jgi:hypothetical protein